VERQHAERQSGERWSFCGDFDGCHQRLRCIFLGASSARVWFPDIDDILDICGVVDAGLHPQASSAVEAFLCGGALPLRSRIPHRLLGARRLHPW
jgi:hypothetical protein